MKKITYPVLISLISIQLYACGGLNKKISNEVISTPALTNTSQENPQPQQPIDLAYTVEAGDILYHIAKKTTNNGDNWQAIAEYNNIDNPRRIKINQVLLIPGYLLPTPENVNVHQNVDKGVEVATVSAEVITPKVEIDEIKQVTDTESISSLPTDINHNDEFSQPPKFNEDAFTGWIMIKGSYYPKAIYTKPNYTEGLLTRVLPGTTLRHIDSEAGWLQVETDRGLGYVHMSDAKIISSEDISTIGQ